MGKATLQTGNIGQVEVGNASTEILSAADTARISHLVVVNDSDETVYVSYGVDAEMNKGIRLNPNGGFFEWFYPNIVRGVAINAICTSGGKNVCYQLGD